jgi:Zn-dependent protease
LGYKNIGKSVSEINKEENMNGSIRIGKVWGIPISLHFSWFFIFTLATWSLANGYFPNEYPALSSGVHLLMGLVTSLLFFGSVLAHELGHANLALRDRIPVKGITLFLFGGVAQISQEPRSPGSEFRIAIAGPLTSLGLAGLFGLLYIFDQAVPILAAPSQYLMRINLMLALFNLIPGFPLDGGRVLRALVWKWTGSLQKATRVASMGGQLTAFAFIGIGILIIVNGQLFNGLWLVFIGWFLQNAASSAYLQLNLQQALQGVRVGQVMNRNLSDVDHLTPISQLVEEWLNNPQRPALFVSRFGERVGFITLQDIKKIPANKWRFTTVHQVMHPLENAPQIDIESDLITALQQMETKNINQISVREGQNLVGLITKDQLINYIRLRAELGV